MSSAFRGLPLRPPLLEALEHVGYGEMTPIQAQALPLLLAGKDVTGQAKTGSGKTAAFGLALLNAVDLAVPTPQALVLCPTRELAEQVAGEVRRLAARMPNACVLTVCGGHSLRDQTRTLAHGAQVVVGTPGRLGQHLREGTLDLSGVGVLVLDEADRMLDMGFIEEVAAIVDRCPGDRQTLLFSATFPDPILALSRRVQREPQHVAVESRVEPEKLRQLVFECAPQERPWLVADLLAEYRPETSLLFCETRNDCEAFADLLTGEGARALVLHGQMDQRDRDDVLIQFANGSVSVLVATNLAARGLDIPSLPMVIITELSPDPETYLHRIGRTGRAGEVGLALTLVVPGERWRLERTERFMGAPLERGAMPPRSDGLAFLTPPNRTLLIHAGRKDKLRKGDVLGALVKEGGLPPEAVGRIDLMPRACAVAVDRKYAGQALHHLRSGSVKKKHLRARLLD